MAKLKKPYPGMGPFVVLVKASASDEFWQLMEGANTDEGARRKMRLYPTYSERKIAPNNVGDPKETRY